MKKWTQVCPLLGVVLIACATGETESPNPLGLGSAGNDGTAGSAEPTAGTGTGGSAVGTAGSSEGGSATSGTGTGGSFTFSGTSSFAGSFGTAGTGTAGTATGGAAGTASGGTGGASAGAGGKASGGAGGKASGGTGGTAGAGGGGNAMCAGTTLPAKGTWTATASASDPAYLPPKVLDGDNGTRWATGTKQVGGEWLQIDFGAIVTVNEITLHTNNGDFFRHYEVRMSNTSQDFAAPILKEADGVTGTIVIPLAQAKAGQYLTIRQTGMVAAGETAWWSLHEVNVACK
ncbi:MAG TPA: discoidin domain-containing protein [Polyangiaceae bacterium]|nr:discoidin domain-containing protein [Polyangiaceae bacterium]